jgi:hypothetical protein
VGAQSGRIGYQIQHVTRLTTASTAFAVRFMANRFLHVLIAAFIPVWIWSAIKPAIPEDWLLENLLVFLAFILLGSSG